MNGGVGLRSARKAQQAIGSKKRKQETPVKCDQEAFARMSPEQPSIYQNGIINNLLNKDKMETPDQVEEQSQGGKFCSMCMRDQGNRLVDMRQNLPMNETLMTYWHLSKESVHNWLRSICVQCIFKINAHKELTMSIGRRFQKLSSQNSQSASAAVNVQQKQLIPHQHHQELLITSLTPDTSPNNFLIPSTEDTPLHTPVLERSCSPVAKTNNCVDELATKATNNGGMNQCEHFDNIQTPPLPTMNNYSMLEVYEERNVSPLTTESGGANRKQSYARVRKIPVQLSCPYCSRTYWRKDYHTKHVRRCKSSQRYAKSITSVRSAKSTHLDVDDETQLTAEFRLDDSRSIPADNNRTQTTTASRLFHCNVCAVTVDSYNKLKEHRRIHLQRFYCDICGDEFTSKYEFEFHRVVCAAKQEAKLAVSTPDPNDDEPALPPRRMTRARSRALSVGSSLAVSTMTTRKKQTKKTSNKTDKPATRQSAKAKKGRPPKTATKKSKQRKRKTADNKSIPPTASSCNENFDHSDSESAVGTYVTNGYNEEDEDDDEVSVPDTMYHRRLSFTGQWVEEHSNSQSIISQFDYNFDYYPFDDDEHLQIHTDKEYDLYLLDRLKLEIISKSFTCFVTDCNFKTDTLPKIMLHDYLEHFKNSWFYCKKCGNCFTSKVFLDYHLDRQNSGRYLCYKCGNTFQYQNQLDRHMIRHRRCINYRCNYCNFEFLTKNELIEHCSLERHDPNGEKLLIGIKRTMTITNRIRIAPPLTRCNLKYDIKILNLQLPKMPSKMGPSMEKFARNLPAHLKRPYLRLHIGQVEFKNQRDPNCWGWM
uniref:C2H2-type domain-containing protein n=1 Tax=Glossina brevipalpis TaxID=37001 RepID=A0A1A9WR10_9MUSC